jgi:hypothetical protein
MARQPPVGDVLCCSGSARAQARDQVPPGKGGGGGEEEVVQFGPGQAQVVQLGEQGGAGWSAAGVLSLELGALLWLALPATAAEQHCGSVGSELPWLAGIAGGPGAPRGFHRRRKLRTWVLGAEGSGNEDIDEDWWGWSVDRGQSSEVGGSSVGGAGSGQRGVEGRVEGTESERK